MKLLKKVYENKILISFIFLFVSILIFVPMIRLYISILEKCFDTNYNIQNIKNIFDIFNIIWNNKKIGLIYFLIDFILIFLVKLIFYTKRQLKIENEGINFKQKDGTHGTANFTTVKDIKNLIIGNEEVTNGIVIGRTLDTNELITLPDEYKEINRNIMVWGASGSRKIYQLYNSKCFKDN